LAKVVKGKMTGGDEEGKGGEGEDEEKEAKQKGSTKPF
jgi:hypothetical protein